MQRKKNASKTHINKQYHRKGQCDTETLTIKLGPHVLFSFFTNG
jgi:hypothetical protein